MATGHFINRSREESDQDWTLSLRLQVHTDPNLGSSEYEVTIVGEQWLEEERELSGPLNLGTMSVIHFPSQAGRQVAAVAAGNPLGAILDHEAGTVVDHLAQAAGIWFLDRIELQPERRGLGLGARALELFVAAVAHEGVLVLTPLNEDVSRYWRRLGFRSANQDGTALYKDLA